MENVVAESPLSLGEELGELGFGVAEPAGGALGARTISAEEQRIVDELNAGKAPGEGVDDLWQNAEETELPADLQADLDSGEAGVLFWRALIMPVAPSKRSKGGIIMVAESIENTQYLTYLGKIIALGPLWCRSGQFADEDRARLPQLKPGDWVIYGRHAGQRVEYKGVKLLLVNDDEKLMKIRSPEGWRIYS